MGCGATLFLADGGYITCSWGDCPRPQAASQMLGGDIDTYRCDACGLSLDPTGDQLEALRRFGNPLRRPPCLETESGLHVYEGKTADGDEDRAAFSEGRSAYDPELPA